MKHSQNTYRSFTIVLLIVLGTSQISLAQSQHKLLRNGDAYYEKNDYSASEEAYRKALELNRSPKGNFNLGNSLYKQERYEEAVEAYQDASIGLTDDIAKSEAYFNMGNAAFQNQDLETSVQAYKEALKLNPSDEEIRSNLFSAMYMKKVMQQQEQQQQQESDEQEPSDEQEKDESQEQQDSESSDESEQQESSEEEQQAAQDSLDQSQSAPQDSLSQAQLDSLMQQVSKEEALRLLQIAEKEEKKVQDKLIRQKKNAKRPDKDW